MGLFHDSEGKNNNSFEDFAPAGKFNTFVFPTEIELFSEQKKKFVHENIMFLKRLIHKVSPLLLLVM